MPVFKFQLGDVLRDKVTGLTGAVMVRAQYYTGCVHYGLCQQSVTSDGKIQDWEWLDTSRLELVKTADAVGLALKDKKAPTSGPSPVGPQL